MIQATRLRRALRGSDPCLDPRNLVHTGRTDGGENDIDTMRNCGCWWTLLALVLLPVIFEASTSNNIKHSVLDLAHVGILSFLDYEPLYYGVSPTRASVSLTVSLLQ